MANYDCEGQFRDPRLVDHFTIRRYLNAPHNFSMCCDIYAAISTALCSRLYSLIMITRISYHDLALVRHFARRFRTLIAFTDTLETHKSTRKLAKKCPSFRPHLRRLLGDVCYCSLPKIWNLWQLCDDKFLGIYGWYPSLRETSEVRRYRGPRISGRCHRMCITWHM